MACVVGYSLPELFGGVLPACGADTLRHEPWLRNRVSERLSVMLLTGTTDFNRAEMERERPPLLAEYRVRTHLHVANGGHALPPPAGLAESLAWLQAGRPPRRALAQRYPASRYPAARAPSAAEWSVALLQEGVARLQSAETHGVGLMQLVGVAERWSALPAGVQAKRLLDEYD